MIGESAETGFTAFDDFLDCGDVIQEYIDADSPEPSNSPDPGNSPEPGGSESGSFFAGKVSDAATKWGTSMNNLKSRWEATKEAYQARKEEVQEAVFERGRQLHHKSRNLVLDVKEQYKERRQDFVHKVVNGLEVMEGSQSSSSSHPEAVEVSQRWWAAACAAAHNPHSLPTAEEAEDTQPQLQPLGSLEVEVLHFSDDPPLMCSDGNRAISPVCQLAFGGKLTGALRPRGWEPPTSSGSGQRRAADAAGDQPADKPPHVSSGQDLAAAGEASGHKSEPDVTTSASSSSSSSSCARFPVGEVFGCDLRVHVFDSDSKKFSIGMEGSAFCGGAFVPLSALLRLHEGFTGPLLGRTFEAEVAVRLLPLEAIKMTSKLQKAETSGLERPAASLGFVVLRLRLTVQEWAPAWMYLKLPYHGHDTEFHADGAHLDNPMSILKAVGRSIERFVRALHPRVFLEAADRLRERLATAILLQALWLCASLIVPVWKVPGCLGLAVVVLAVESAAVRRETAEAPRLFRDELGGGAADDKPKTEGSSLGMVGRTKRQMTQAVKLELRLLQFARTITKAAVVAEKVRYILTLQDLHLSLMIAFFGCCALAAVTVWLRVAAAIFGIHMWWLILWAGGSLILLPARGRARVAELAQKFIALKQRVLGPGRWRAVARALWRRIPDSLECQHCELAERYLLSSWTAV